MNRAWMVLIAGLFIAAAAYLGSYYAGTSGCHRLEHYPAPELAWLKEEFHLSDAEFGRIRQMHDAYLAGCAQRCRQIDERNAHLRVLLAATNAVTPEIERTLNEAAQLRAECQKKMLEHFYEVSKTMPPDQGKRYLAWVQAQTVLPDAHREMQHGQSPMSEEQHSRD